MAQTESRAQAGDERLQMAEYYLAMNVQGRIQDGIASIAGDFDEHDTNLYGNDELGWWRTGFGVEAERYDRMANLLLMDNEEGDDGKVERVWESME